MESSNAAWEESRQALHIKIFEHNEFGAIRTVLINNEPCFVGKDIAEELGYKNVSDAILKHVDEEDKGVAKCDTLGGKQNLIVINESGLFSLVLGSKLPKAKKFKRWVTSEVLPSIRKHGAYMTGEVIERALSSPDFLIDLATKLKEEQLARQQAENLIQEQKPKVVFADAVAGSDNLILVRDLAKLIKQNGVDIGEKRLFQWLRKNGYLINRKGSDYNSPTQRSMDMKLFEVKETAITHGNGKTTLSRTSKVTGKGQQYFINKLLNT